MHFAGSHNDSLILGYYLRYKLCFIVFFPYVITRTLLSLKIRLFIPCFMSLFTPLFIPCLSNLLYTFWLSLDGF